MKAKNILMTLLLVTGAIAAKAANGYPPELALVSQPVMVYNYNSITIYYDVQNIGDYTYRGDIYLYLDPDNGHYYANKYVKVCPGRIKRVAVEIPSYRINPYRAYTIMPYYELGDELYSFTTFEYFEPLSFYWDGRRDERWVVVTLPPRPRYYTRPGTYRYYYDGFRPPMPPPNAHGYAPATPPPPMNPMHHTYNHHSNNGGYPANNNWNNNPPAPNNNSGTTAPSATVRPKANAGSMSSGHSGNAPAPNNNTGNVSRPSNNNSSGTNSNGSVSRPSNNSGRPSGNSNSGSVSRPSNSSSSGTSSSGSSSGRSSSNSTRSSSGSNRSGSSTSTRGSR